MIFKLSLFLTLVLWIVSVQSFDFFGFLRPKQSSSYVRPHFSLQSVTDVEQHHSAAVPVVSSSSNVPKPKPKPAPTPTSITPATTPSSSSSGNNNIKPVSSNSGNQAMSHKSAKSESSSHLPYLPTNLTRLSQLQYRSNNTAQGSRALINNLTPQQEAQLHLADYTLTDLSCYIAPPLGTIVDMNKLMGFWTLVRKVNNDNGTDRNYVCEQIVYTATGPNTFDKIADVHYGHKFSTIKGNGTFLSPGIMILDWKNLKDNTKYHRLVYTVIATDYTEYVVGYNCNTKRKTPEVVLETRRTKVPLSILNQAYKDIRASGLPLSDLVCQKGFTNSYNLNSRQG